MIKKLVLTTALGAVLLSSISYADNFERKVSDQLTTIQQQVEALQNRGADENTQPFESDLRISKEMQARLNHQIQLEYESSNIYLQMAAWCNIHDFDNCENFMTQQALEERGHMKKIFDYMLESGAYPRIPKLEAPKSDYHSFQQVFKTSLAHEKMITSEINDITGFALSEKDFATFGFMQWYVAEQREEEKLFSTILGRLNFTDVDDDKLYVGLREE